MKDDSNNATQPAEEGDGQRCRYCEGDIDTGRVTLCSLHAAAPTLYEALSRFAGLLNEIDAWTPIAGDGDGNAFLPCSMRISDLEQARAALAAVRNQNEGGS